MNAYLFELYNRCSLPGCLCHAEHKEGTTFEQKFPYPRHKKGIVMAHNLVEAERKIRSNLLGGYDSTHYSVYFESTIE